MKTYIWTLPTRLVHWILAIGLVVAYILGEEEISLNLHSSIGYLVVSIVLFRILWGFIGPKYSRFSDFPISPKSISGFFSNMKESKAANKGHNPLASVIMLLIYIDILAVGLTGILSLASEGQGLFASLFAMNGSEIYEELHEVFVQILLILVIIHLLGILVDLVLHRQNGTLLSMISGYKKFESESAKLNRIQKIFAFIWIILPLLFFIYSINTQNITEEEHEENTQQEHLDKDYD